MPSAGALPWEDGVLLTRRSRPWPSLAEVSITPGSFIELRFFPSQPPSLGEESLCFGRCYLRQCGGSCCSLATWLQVLGSSWQEMPFFLPVT